MSQSLYGHLISSLASLHAEYTAESCVIFHGARLPVAVLSGCLYGWLEDSDACQGPKEVHTVARPKSYPDARKLVQLWTEPPETPEKPNSPSCVHQVLTEI